MYGCTLPGYTLLYTLPSVRCYLTRWPAGKEGPPAMGGPDWPRPLRDSASRTRPRSVPDPDSSQTRLKVTSRHPTKGNMPYLAHRAISRDGSRDESVATISSRSTVYGKVWPEAEAEGRAGPGRHGQTGTVSARHGLASTLPVLVP